MRAAAGIAVWAALWAALVGALILGDAAGEHLPIVALLLAVALTAATVDRLTRPEGTDR